MSTRCKRLVVTALLLALLVPLLRQPAAAADIYFTAVNNTLLELSEENMPVSINGTMYVPYTVFNSRELGTYAIYSYSSQTVVILGGQLELYYDMSRGMTYDQDDEEQTFRAVFRHGRVYVPAYATSQFFGMTYSYITGSIYGDIVRITTGGAMDDYSFVTSASSMMQSYLNDYLRNTTPEVTPPPVTPSAAVTTPTPTPPVIRDVELCFACTGVEGAEAVMDAFEQRNSRVCFFLTEEEIRAQPSLAREICGRGHAIGLLLTEPIEESWARASALLFEAAAYRTQLAALDTEATEQAREAAERLGLNLWFDGNTARLGAEELQTLREQLPELEGRVDLVLDLSGETAAALEELLGEVRGARYSFRQLRETAEGILPPAEGENTLVREETQ